ncbi:hypothetical protein A2U01_0069775, partial [Trifolium medium]|nr:hypothetical protein [Trifolium medium]
CTSMASMFWMRVVFGSAGFCFGSGRLFLGMVRFGVAKGRFSFRFGSGFLMRVTGLFF